MRFNPKADISGGRVSDVRGGGGGGGLGNIPIGGITGGGIGTTIIVIIIFGAGRLPEIGGALGKGIKEFKSQANSDEELAATTTSPSRANHTMRCVQARRSPRSRMDGSM